MGIVLTIRDGAPDWWASPDIWVVPGTDPNGPAGAPIVGQNAYLWATVSNSGTEEASQVQVDFWIANPSLQIRKSTATHVGTAFADIPPGTSQDVLCLVPWHVALMNGGHECIVVEATSAADPLAPPPTDPDLLDAPTYRQIAQRNVTVVLATAQARPEMIIGVHAGSRANKRVEVRLESGTEVSQALLESLGLRGLQYLRAERGAGTLALHSQCGSSALEQHDSINVQVPMGQSAAVYLTLASHNHLKPNAYSVLKVIEDDAGRTIGGLTIIIARSQSSKGGSQ